MTPERRLELELEELRRLLEQVRALPDAAMVEPEQACAALVALAEAALARGDRTSASLALDALLVAPPPERPQPSEVRRLRERRAATRADELVEGLEPAERAMAAGYLLMAAQDGELSADESAALEDRLASAEAGLRVEWTWLERARAAMSRVALTEPTTEAWERLFAAAGRLKGPRTADVDEVRARVAGSTSKVSLRDLEEKGLREVRVLRAGDVDSLILRAVESVLAAQPRGRGVSQAERDRIFAEARAEVDRHVDAVRELEAERQRVELERAQVEQARQRLEAKLAEVNRQLLAERQPILLDPQAPPAGPPEPGDHAPRALRTGDLVVAGLHVRASDGPTGDWFELVERASGGLDVIVGDASGTGSSAAMAAACTRTALHALLDRDDSPAAALGAANRGLCRTLPRGAFVSAAVARCDGAGRVVVGSAAHEPAIVYRARERRAERVKLGGVVLGALERGSDHMAEHGFDLAPGDALVLLTDGVTEALSPADAPFDEQRLLDAVAQHGGSGPEGLVEALVGEVQRWAGDRPLEDDVVVVAIARSGAEDLESHLARLQRALREQLLRLAPGRSAADLSCGDDLFGEALEGSGRRA